jgi:bifunctional non-homologous end joining protein LigD
MQPALARPPFHRDGWIYEEKVDGWRMLAYKDGRRVRLVSRRGVDHGARFPELVAALAELRPERLVLDGEVAVFDDTLVSQFHLLNDPDPAVVCTPPLLIAFDCLSLGARDLRAKPLRERRRALEDVVHGAGMIFPVRRLAIDGFEAWDVVTARRYEGLVAKDHESSYRGGESRDWVKVKFRQDGRFLVTGVGETADGAPRLFVAELVAGKLVHRGTVELGVGPRLVAEVMRRGRQRPTSPCHALRARGVTWLEPRLAVELSYGRLMQGWLREPVCRGLVTEVIPRRGRRAAAARPSGPRPRGRPATR